MKRIIIILSAIVLLAACQKENRIQEPELSTVTYSVAAPVEFETKAAGDASRINVLWYGVYHKKESGEFKYMSDMSAFVDVTYPSSIQVPITLINNQVYRLVFVAQHKSDEEYVYNIGEDGVMTLNPDAEVTDGEQMDAFVYWEETEVITQGYNKEIKLSRPLAQINVGTTAAELPQSVSLTVSGVPASYDIFNGQYAGEATLNYTFDVPAGETIDVASTAYSRLASMYIFGGNKIDCTISYKKADDTEVTHPITDVETETNYKTNIVGNI